MPGKRLAAERTDELLMQIMDVIAVEGFASLKVADLARRLRCSTSTLYRISPSKESLILTAITHWADWSLEAMKLEAEKSPTAAERARAYYHITVRSASTLSPAFRADVSYFASTQRLYISMIERQAEQFMAYMNEAVESGEVRPINVRFLAMVCHRMGRLVSDPNALEQLGLERGDAFNSVESLIWEGLLPRE
jgi:AcrR family transcriptional regulator